MSEIDHLKSELQEVDQKISDRKQLAKEKGIHETAVKIAKSLGKYSDWGEGEYNYSDKILSISCSQRDYIKIQVPAYQGNEVFSGYPNEASIYIPGEWENLFQTLLEKVPSVEEAKEINSLKRKIHDLKKKWDL